MFGTNTAQRCVQVLLVNAWVVVPAAPSAAKLVGADVPRRAHGAAVALEIIGKDPSETDASINGGTATLQVEVPPRGIHKVGIAKQVAAIVAGARVQTAAPSDGV